MTTSACKEHAKTACVAITKILPNIKVISITVKAYQTNNSAHSTCNMHVKYTKWTHKTTIKENRLMKNEFTSFQKFEMISLHRKSWCRGISVQFIINMNANSVDLNLTKICLKADNDIYCWFSI